MPNGLVMLPDRPAMPDTGTPGVSSPFPSLGDAGRWTADLRWDFPGFADLAAAAPGAAAQDTPARTIIDPSITDSAGRLLTVFPVPIALVIKYNAADVQHAFGDPSRLTAVHLVDQNTPEIANPLHLPIGSRLLFPAGDVSVDTVHGIIVVLTHSLGSPIAVVPNPVGDVSALADGTPLMSGYDKDAQVLGTRPKGTLLNVAEPLIGNRFLVFDPQSGNYAYVNFWQVAPVGSGLSTS
ncbi:MAG: hypothetical protein JOZ39_04615 [Chloroflexi bacterium]|nr:hypothetical protein [Chloroflexota bacterium]